MLFSKVLGKNEQFVFYFYLKTEGTFWTQTRVHAQQYWFITLKGQTCKNTASHQGARIRHSRLSGKLNFHQLDIRNTTLQIGLPRPL